MRNTEMRERNVNLRFLQENFLVKFSSFFFFNMMSLLICYGFMVAPFLQIKNSCSQFCAHVLAIDLLKNNRIPYISQMQEATNYFVIPILCISASQWQYKYYQMAMCSNYYRVLQSQNEASFGNGHGLLCSCQNRHKDR